MTRKWCSKPPGLESRMRTQTNARIAGCLGAHWPLSFLVYLKLIPRTKPPNSLWLAQLLLVFLPDSVLCHDIHPAVLPQFCSPETVPYLAPLSYVLYVAYKLKEEKEARLQKVAEKSSIEKPISLLIFFPIAPCLIWHHHKYMGTSASGQIGVTGPRFTSPIKTTNNLVKI